MSDFGFNDEVLLFCRNNVGSRSVRPFRFLGCEEISDLVMSSYFSSDLLARLVDAHLFCSVPVRVAEEDDVSPETLARLASLNDRDVLCRVARHPSTPPDALVHLSYLGDWDVSLGVARNRNTPVEVLIELASDVVADIRSAVAFNRNTPIEVLFHLASDEDKSVREKVFETLKASPSISREFVIARDGLSSEEAEQVRALPDTYFWSMYEETFSAA